MNSSNKILSSLTNQLFLFVSNPVPMEREFLCSCLYSSARVLCSQECILTWLEGPTHKPWSQKDKAPPKCSTGGWSPVGTFGLGLESCSVPKAVAQNSWSFDTLDMDPSQLPMVLWLHSVSFFFSFSQPNIFWFFITQIFTTPHGIPLDSPHSNSKG